MRKTVFLLVLMSFFLFLTTSVYSQWECPIQIFSDDFNRYTLPPWQSFITQPSGVGTCTSPQCEVKVYSPYLDEICDTPNHLCWAMTNITPVSEFEWIFNYTPAGQGTWFVAEWSHQGQAYGSFASVRFYNPLTTEQYFIIDISINSIITDVQTNPYPFGYVCRSELDWWGFDTWKINKTGNTIRVFAWHVNHWDEKANCTSYYFNGVATTIGFGTYSPYYSATNYVDKTAVCSKTSPKIQPTLTIEVSPSVNVTSGTQTMVSCKSDYNDVPVVLSYFGTQVSNPDIKTLPVGHHWYFCDSNETEKYFEAHTARDLWVYEPTYITATIPPYIGNATEPNPAMVNATEWQEAGYGWALVFFMPVSLIGIVSLIISAIIGRLSGKAEYAIIAFAFIFFLLILYTGIIPSWVFVIFIIIASIIGTAYILKVGGH